MKNKLFQTVKPMLSVVTAVAILAVSLFAAIAGIDFTASAAAVEDTWDGTLATGFESGSGAEDDPYIIATAEQLAYAALGDPTVSAGKYFKVVDNATFNLSGMKDITLDSTVGDVMTADTDKNWRTASDAAFSFAGYFDGNGVIVYNMYSSGYAQSGLFPRSTNNNADNASWIKNVTLLASRSNGFNSAGGLVGEYHAPDTSRVATIENCKVLNCWISDNNNANAAAQRTSGILVGHITHNAATIKNCFASGNVTSATEISGGLVGQTSLYCPSVSIQNCIVIGSNPYPTVTGSNQKINKHLDVAGTYSAVYTDQAVDAKFAANQVKQLAEADMKGAAAKNNMPDFDWSTWIAFEGELPDYRANHTLTLAQNDSATHNITCTDCNKAMAETHNFVENAAGTVGTCECGYSAPITDRRTDVWDGSYDSNFPAGTGTKADPYIIKTAEQMAHVALKSTPDTSKGKYYQVAPNMVFNMNGMSGITLDSTATDVMNAEEGKDWFNDSNKFAGNFDGNGVIVYNVRSSNGRSYGHSALFPVVNTNNAETTVTIKNITVLASRFKGYHASAGIVGTADCAAGGQVLIVENCAVKNCYIGDGGNTNTACSRTAATIVGNAGNNVVTINNCLSVDNILAGTDISGGFIGNTGIYSGSNSTIKNSVMIGSMPYPVAISGNRIPSDYATNAECFKNVYTDQAINGYSSNEIQVLTSGQMSGVDAIQNMDLDFGAYWFANGGLIELLVSHNIAGGTANPDDNYAGHTASCKVCGLSSVSIINHVYNDEFTCTVCGFNCDHKNSEYITESEVALDCVTPHHLKKECACGYEERTVYEEATGHKLTKIEQKAPGCDTTGNIEHWQCEECKSLFLTDDAWASMDNAVTVDSVTIAATGEHTVTTDSNGKIVYGMDFNTHWTVCSECGKTIKSDNHTTGYTSKDDKTHSVECTICLYEIIESEEHVLGTDERCDKCSWACSHEGTLVLVSKADADCENDGAVVDHYLCTNCNVRYADEAAIQSVAKSDVVIDKLGHSFVDADDDGKADVNYSKDNHWYHCETCDKDIFESHEYTTTSEDGSTGICDCGYEGAVNEKIVDEWDGTFDSNLTGDGTKNNPYIIKTAEQMAYVALKMSYTESADKYFKVAPCRVFNMNGKTGITLDSTAIQVRSAAINQEWQNPDDTDNATKTFAGHFDGNGVIVYNVYTKGAYGGLFPNAASDNNLKSLSIKNVTLVASFMQGYHYAGGIVGQVSAATSSQSFSIENCAVKNCYIGDNGDKNELCHRTAGAIIGNVTHNTTTMENCFAIDNIVEANNIAGGLIGNSSDYAAYVEIKDSVIIGTTAYPELQPNAASDRKISDKIIVPSVYTNIYTDCDVFGYGKTQIRKLSIDNMSGMATIQNMSLDFDAYWFANEGVIDLFVCHNITGSADATDNYAGHAVYCKDCGIKGVAIAAHNYNEQYVCTVCDFECDHKNDKYISELLIEFDCITSKQTAFVCSCGYIVKTTEHIKADGHKFEKYEAKDPTCAVAGNIEYNLCENCECVFLTDDVWASYDQAINEKETEIPATGAHTLEEADGKVVYSKDDESHWINCTVCAAKLQRVEHVVSYSGEGTTHNGVCSVCDYEVVKSEAHTFSRDHDNCDDCKWICPHDGTVVKVEESAPTCTEDGVKTAHYKCTVCDMRFTDEAANTQINKSEVVLAKLGHDYIDFDANGTPVHEFNDTHHWYNCKVCGKGDYAEHSISTDSENYEGTYKWCEDENGYGCNYSTFDYSAVDEEIQIAVTAPTNAFKKDVITDIFKIKRDHLYYEKFVEVFAKNGITQFDAYEITPSQELPEGVKATINMISPEMYGLKASLVFVNLETGKLELIASNVESITDPTSKKGEEKYLSLLTAKTGKFGYFAIVSTLDIEGNENIIGGDGDSSTISPPTGDDSMLIVIFMVILASATILFVRKANKI